MLKKDLKSQQSSDIGLILEEIYKITPDFKEITDFCISY